MKDQPSLESLPAPTRPLIARCLEKNPRQRLQAIGEARIALENPETPLAAALPVAQIQGVTRRHWAGWAVAILALAFAFLYPRQQPLAEHTLRYTIALPRTVWCEASPSRPTGSCSLSRRRSMANNSSGCDRSTPSKPSHCRPPKVPCSPSGRPTAATLASSRRASSKR
jgi:hypothetical protein